MMSIDRGKLECYRSWEMDQRWMRNEDQRHGNASNFHTTSSNFPKPPPPTMFSHGLSEAAECGRSSSAAAPWFPFTPGLAAAPRPSG